MKKLLIIQLISCLATSYAFAMDPNDQKLNKYKDLEDRVICKESWSQPWCYTSRNVYDECKSRCRKNMRDCNMEFFPGVRPDYWKKHAKEHCGVFNDMKCRYACYKQFKRDIEIAKRLVSEKEAK